MEHVSIKNVATPLVNDLYPLPPVYSGQQVRVLGESYTLRPVGHIPVIS